ncbi:hypothetical protein [Mycobacterium intracellulare]|uniref:hypothetical protein n=1 Tax=Mycobacterium intracellulare TaxID=1767 RepID=UPI00080B4169|nr:hypothetical protein [Mycobacterium intracellulare]OCB17790.1 hypothetical protein A5689_23610 [Mycobacterium intracellulare subsp. yongonense]
MSSAGAAGEALGDGVGGAGLLEAGARVDDGAAEFDVVVESLPPTTTSVITTTVITAVIAPPTHQGQRRRRRGGGYPMGGMPGRDLTKTLPCLVVGDGLKAPET